VAGMEEAVCRRPTCCLMCFLSLCLCLPAGRKEVWADGCRGGLTSVTWAVICIQEPPSPILTTFSACCLYKHVFCDVMILFSPARLELRTFAAVRGEHWRREALWNIKRCFFSFCSALLPPLLEEFLLVCRALPVGGDPIGRLGRRRKREDVLAAPAYKRCGAKACITARPGCCRRSIPRTCAAAFRATFTIAAAPSCCTAAPRLPACKRRAALHTAFFSGGGGYILHFLSPCDHLWEHQEEERPILQ